MNDVKTSQISNGKDSVKRRFRVVRFMSVCPNVIGIKTSVTKVSLAVVIVDGSFRHDRPVAGSAS